MTSDFDTIIDRRGMNSLKWDVAEDELPMWVADMDFPVAKPILDAVLAKVRRASFGYGVVPPEFAGAIGSWWLSRYDWEIDPEWVVFCDGIMPAVSSLIRTLTSPGDPIVVQSPVYNCFYSTVAECGRVISANNLRYEHGRFSIDWEDLEAKLADPRATVFLLCNPQNPTGQIWSREDLARVGALARAHGVLVVSDEIHCDITEPGARYTPFASAGEDCTHGVTMVSPTKPFNIPGLQSAAAIVPDPGLRAQVAASLQRDEICLPNSFAVEAAIAAYTQSADWLDQMRAYVWNNKARLSSYVSAHLPQLSVIPSQATYLCWVDCSNLTDDTVGFCDFLRKETGLILNPGQMYGDNTRSFVRINLACPASLLEDGLSRLTRGVQAWETAH